MRWDRLGRWTTFLAARWLVRLFRFDRFRSLGAIFGDWQYRLNFFHRRRCLADIAVVLGCSAEDPRVSSTLRSGYRINTISSLEVASMIDRKIDAALLYERCRVDGIENLGAARCGRGAILLATHACNSLLLLAQLADKGWPISLVYRRSPSVPRPFMVEGLRHYDFEGIAANEGFRAYASMVDALRRDRVVFAMMDDAVRKAETGLVLRFLGKDMPMAGGMVQLARHTRAPIVPITSLAAEPVWHFHIEPQLRLLPGGSFEEDTALVLKHFESRILARPELWSWPHRRWSRYPMAAGCKHT